MFKGNQHLLKRCPAAKVLGLKVSCPVILIKNMTRGFYNGQRGIIKALEDNGPTVDFDGKLVKLKPEKFEISTDRGQTVKAKREQYPLKVAYGLSVHHAHGLTIPYLVVDSRSFFQARAVWCCSRPSYDQR